MFSFIIPTCIKEQIHFNQLIRCIESIFKYHCDSNIYIIDDSDENYKKNNQNLLNNYDNLFIINSIIKGSADQQIFKIILDINNNSSHFIIIQDSMFLNLKLCNIEYIKDIKFLWHFTNHRLDWDNIIEPGTEYNINNNITTHTDLIKNCIKKDYSNDINFYNYAINALNNKNIWVGCFGNCCIVTKDFIYKLNEKTNFVNKFMNYTSNRERRANESIFSLLCYYYFPQNYEQSYDGLYYDGINVNKYFNKPTEFDNLVYCCKNYYVSKISFNR